MAIWMSALKYIPWGDVLEAAPHVARGAKRLFREAQDERAPEPAPPLAPTASGDERAAALAAQLAQLQASLAEVREEQRASAELIDSLAQHNERAVQAIAVLRARARLLLWLAGAQAVALLALALWTALR